MKYEHKSNGGKFSLNRHYSDVINNMKRENEVLWRELRSMHYELNIFSLGDDHEQEAWDEYKAEVDAEIAHNG